MRAARRIALCFILLATPLRAEGDRTTAWLRLVQSRVALALASSGRRAEPGHVEIGFTIGRKGEVFGIHAEGPPDAARQAAQALRSLRRLPPPPDHRVHAIKVPVTNG